MSLLSAKTAGPNAGLRKLNPSGAAPRPSLRAAKRASVVTRIAEMERTGASQNGSSHATADIVNIIKYQFGKRSGIDEKDLYRGTAWAVRQQLMDAFERTHDYWA
jgi:starch phosphorylase